MDMSLSKLWETVKDREACSPWGDKQPDMTQRLNNNKMEDEDGGVFKYTCYPSNNFDTVRQQQAKVKEKFPQVFVVAFMDGKRADLYQAKQQALKKK